MGHKSQKALLGHPVLGRRRRGRPSSSSPFIPLGRYISNYQPKKASLMAINSACEWSDCVSALHSRFFTMSDSYPGGRGGRGCQRPSCLLPPPPSWLGWVEVGPCGKRASQLCFDIEIPPSLLSYYSSDPLRPGSAGSVAPAEREVHDSVGRIRKRRRRRRRRKRKRRRRREN